MSPIVVDLITLMVMALPFAADTAVTFILERKAGRPGVKMEVHLRVACLGAIPLLLRGGYTVACSWHYALTFAETWGLATIVTGKLVIWSVRGYVSRHSAARREEQRPL